MYTSASSMNESDGRRWHLGRLGRVSGVLIVILTLLAIGPVPKPTLVAPPYTPYYLNQSLITQDGRTAYGRTCTANTTGGRLWTDPPCNEANKSPDEPPLRFGWRKSNTAGLGFPGDPPLGGIGSMVYPATDPLGQWWLFQSVITLDGKRGWSRYCPVNSNTGPNWNQCRNIYGQAGLYVWDPPFDTTTLPTGGSWELSMYYNPKTGMMHQTVIGLGGTQAYQRTCPVYSNLPPQNAIQWNLCSVFTPPPMLTNPTAKGAISAFTDYLYMENNMVYYWQSTVLASDYVTSPGRRCDVNPSSYAPVRCVWTNGPPPQDYGLYDTTRFRGYDVFIYPISILY